MGVAHLNLYLPHSLMWLSVPNFLLGGSRVMPVWIQDFFQTGYAWFLTPGIYNPPTAIISRQMEPNSVRREKIAKILEREAGNSENIVTASMEIWDQVSLPLARMIGRLGVASLFERCVSIQSSSHSWLPHGHKAVLDESLYTSVWGSLRQQPPEVALTTCIDVLTCFFELLSTLIGERLTMRVFLTGISDDKDESNEQEIS